jgi:hypothetical protein
VTSDPELDAYRQHRERKAAERGEPAQIGPVAPEGWEWAVDFAEDPYATGGHIPADADERPYVPKLRRIVVDRCPTHPTARPLHFNGHGTWLPEEPS